MLQFGKEDKSEPVVFAQSGASFQNNTSLSSQTSAIS